MAKIMLVEDDNNLREIYEARLLAEGYEIVSAKDGEEALALSVKEKPDLIIADVMMPKISGFDMLDILRGTPDTKNTKVIMMTALSQAEDKARASRLGADRYLVKSQVTLEDVAKTAREVLEGTPTGTAVSAPTEQPARPMPAPVTASTSIPVTMAPDNPAPVTPVDDTSGAAGAAFTSSNSKPVTPIDIKNEEVVGQTMAEPLKQEDITIEDQIENFANNGTKTAQDSDAPDISGVVPAPESSSKSYSNAKAASHAGSPSNSKHVDSAEKDDHVAPDPTIISPSQSSDSSAAERESNDSMLADAVAKISDSMDGGSRQLLDMNTGGGSNKDGSSNDDTQMPITSIHTKVIKPINDITKQHNDFEALVAAEEAKEKEVTTVKRDKIAKQPIVNDIKPESNKTSGSKLPAQTIHPAAPAPNDPNSIAI